MTGCNLPISESVQTPHGVAATYSEARCNISKSASSISFNPEVKPLQSVTLLVDDQRQNLNPVQRNLETDSPGSIRTESLRSTAKVSSRHLPDIVVDSRFELDSRALLRAFRMIGGYDGIDFDELSSKIAGIRNEQVRKPLEKNLEADFLQADLDGNGVLDVIEFEHMVNNSTLMQKAVYELLSMAENNEEDVYLDFEKQGQGADVRRSFEMLSLLLVVANVLCMAISVDQSPDWNGWHYIELVFVSMFSLDIIIRIIACSAMSRGERSVSEARAEKSILQFSRTFAKLGSRRSTMDLRLRSKFFRQTLKISSFLVLPVNLVDFLTVVSGWAELIIIFSQGGNSTVATRMRYARFLRFARLARLGRIIFWFPSLRAVVCGMLSGIRTVVLGFTVIGVVVFLWAIVIRQSIVQGIGVDNDGHLKSMFPDMMRSMQVIFRCLALNSEGACAAPQGTLFELLHDAYGWHFQAFWIATEVFVLLGIFNVVASVFVVHAIHNETHIREDINATKHREDEIRLASLDKLLRTLVHPAREQSNPKDRRAAEVAQLIQTDHPAAARKIPNLEKEVVSFAHSIQDSIALLESAMEGYEAREFEECRKLKNTPSAKLFMVDGEERLLVDQNDENITNYLGIPLAPVGAVEVSLVQQREDLADLLEEAAEVQAFVKSIIMPHSEWAAVSNAGASGDVWKISNGLCDEAIDPGPKDIERIEQKVFMKYGGRFERCRDYSRLGLIYKSVGHLVRALPRFLEYRLGTDGIQVVYLENRFVSAHQTGWRDMALLVKVRVPSSGSHHIMEMQLQLEGLTNCRDKTHKFYEEIRAHLPDAVVTTILDRLVTDTTLDLGITKDEWMQCLHNSEVKKLLDGLGIPLRCRATLFELVDIDGSGTVTSSELKDTLRLYRSPVQELELAACHLRVRDIQRHAQTKLEPQLLKVQKDLQHEVEEILYLLKEALLGGLGSDRSASDEGASNVDRELYSLQRWTQLRRLSKNSWKAKQKRSELASSSIFPRQKSAPVLDLGYDGKIGKFISSDKFISSESSRRSPANAWPSSLSLLSLGSDDKNGKIASSDARLSPTNTPFTSDSTRSPFARLSPTNSPFTYDATTLYSSCRESELEPCPKTEPALTRVRRI